MIKQISKIATTEQIDEIVDKKDKLKGKLFYEKLWAFVSE